MSELYRDEIIKELEGLVKFRTCPEYVQKAFALIIELTEENMRLRAEEKQSQILIKTLHDKLDEGYAKFVDEERADTVREMQERLTLEFDRMHKSNFMTPEVRQWIIDQIAKEMLEEK